MRFGLYVTNQHPLDADPVVALDGQLELVRAARDLGWDAVFTGHHYLVDRMTMLQPVPFLARVSAEARHMRMGLGILLTALLNPVHAAETAATIDVITGGRLVLGAGLGYRDAEYDAFGVPRDRQVERFERNLDLIVRLLEGEAVDAALPWCRLRGATLSVPPVQRPRPPVWVAANSDRAVQRAARLADTWLVNPHARLGTVARQLELFAGTRRGAGLPPPAELPALKEVFCAQDRATAMARVRPHLDAKYRAYAAWGQDRALPADDGFDLPFERLVTDRFLIGSPDDVIQQLEPWTALGIDHLIVRTHWSGMPVEHSLQSIRLLTDHVLPALHAGAAPASGA